MLIRVPISQPSPPAPHVTPVTSWRIAIEFSTDIGIALPRDRGGDFFRSLLTDHRPVTIQTRDAQTLVMTARVESSQRLILKFSSIEGVGAASHLANKNKTACEWHVDCFHRVGSAGGVARCGLCRTVSGRAPMLPVDLFHAPTESGFVHVLADQCQAFSEPSGPFVLTAKRIGTQAVVKPEK